MQRLGTEKKNHATSQDKKKSLNLWGQKNHATFCDKKKSRNHLVQKKITQPFGTKMS